MTLRVEDGSIVANANSYASLTFADSFFEDIGDTVWAAASDDNKEFALIRAALYMQQSYRMRWEGARLTATQSMDWPRQRVAIPDYFDPFYRNSFVPISFENSYFVPVNVVPTEVKQAQCLLARATMDTSGAPTISLQQALGRVTKREKLGELEVEYADGVAGQRIMTIYWDSRELLRPFLKAGSSTTGSVVRS